LGRFSLVREDWFVQHLLSGGSEINGWRSDLEKEEIRTRCIHRESSR
jgi:hypothetical protein